MLENPLFYSALSRLWIILLFALAGVAFFRFRGTASGILIGMGFSLMGLKLVIYKILKHFMDTDIPNASDYRAMMFHLSFLIRILLILLIIVGIALIPKSLRALAKKTGAEG